MSTHSISVPSTARCTCTTYSPTTLRAPSPTSADAPATLASQIRRCFSLQFDSSTTAPHASTTGSSCSGASSLVQPSSLLSIAASTSSCVTASRTISDSSVSDGSPCVSVVIDSTSTIAPTSSAIVTGGETCMSTTISTGPSVSSPHIRRRRVPVTSAAVHSEPAVPLTSTCSDND